jgi:hypothetical protein
MASRTKALRDRRDFFARRSIRARREAGRLSATLATAMFIPPSYHVYGEYELYRNDCQGFLSRLGASMRDGMALLE